LIEGQVAILIAVKNRSHNQKTADIKLPNQRPAAELGV
jgi:hypothetical protein